jgi:hypothetical protein
MRDLSCVLTQTAGMRWRPTIPAAIHSGRYHVARGTSTSRQPTWVNGSTDLGVSQESTYPVGHPLAGTVARHQLDLRGARDAQPQLDRATDLL